MHAGRKQVNRVGSYITPSGVLNPIKGTGSLTVNLHENHATPEADRDEIYNLTNHRESLVSGISALYATRDLCDVVLTVENASFQAHKVVLAASSEYLREMFVLRRNKLDASESEMTKVPLLGIKASTVSSILEGMYDGTITLSAKTVDDTLSAASFLRIPRIVKACENFLAKHLNVINCLRTLQVANLYELKELLEESYRLASTNFNTVCQQKELLKLRYCELRGILPREDLNVPSEVTVFQAVVRWIEADKSTRIIYAGRLMCHVRFPLIPENELVDTVESSPYVCQVAEVGELAREAVRYHLLPHRRSAMQNTRTTPRTTINIEAMVACGGLALKREGSLTDKMFFCDFADGKWKPFAQLPEPRHHHAVATMGRFIYVAGGDSSDGCRTPSKKVWRYDSWSEEWLQVANMGVARESFQLVAMEMKLYAIGGRSTRGLTVNNVEVYNPANDTWEGCRPISSPRRHTAATAFCGRIYVAGGSSDDLVSRRVESYFPVNAKWERRQPLVKPRFSGSLHAIDRHLWLVGGASVDAQEPAMGIFGASEIEIYSPANDQWSLLKSDLKFDDVASPCSMRRTSQTAWDSTQTTPQPESSIDGTDREIESVGLSVALTRSEAGYCSHQSKIFMIAGYSWFSRGRIDNVECIDTSRARKEATIDDAPKPHPGGSEKVVESAVDVDCYPLRCTGVACAVVTLYKNPDFKPKEPETAVCKAENDSSSLVSSPIQKRIAPKSASPLIRQAHDSSTADSSRKSSRADLERPPIKDPLQQQARAITNSMLNRGASATPRPRGCHEITQRPTDKVMQWLNSTEDITPIPSTETETAVQHELCDSTVGTDAQLVGSKRHGGVFLTQ